MKKFIVSLLLVAALAASNSFAQVLVGGSPAPSTSVSNSAPTSAPAVDLGLSVHAWTDTYLQSSVQTLSSGELGTANNSDAIVNALLKGEAGVQGQIGSVFYLKAMSFYDVSNTGLSSATVIGGPGAKIGPVSFGANVGTDLTTWKGFKLGLDSSWDIVPGMTIYAWGNYNLNGGKNHVISTAGVYSVGTVDYTAFDAGLGADCFLVSGLYLGFVGSVYGNNNEWVTMNGNRITTSSQVVGKIGFVQDGRLVYLGLGWRGGESIITPTTDPKASNKFLFEVGFKLQ